MRVNPETGAPTWPSQTLVGDTGDYRGGFLRAVASDQGAWVVGPSPPDYQHDPWEPVELRATFLGADGTVAPPGAVSLGYTLYPEAQVRRAALPRSADDLLVAKVELVEAGGEMQRAVIERFAVGGAPVWTEPVRMDTPAGTRTVRLVDDGSDGAWVIQNVFYSWDGKQCPLDVDERACWYSCLPDLHSIHIIAQHLDEHGVARFAGDGILVALDPGLYVADAYPDGAGGVFVVWWRDEPTFYFPWWEPRPPGQCQRSYFVAHVDSAGLVNQWPLLPGHAAVIGEREDQVFTTAAGGYLFVVLFDRHSEDHETATLWAARYGSDGRPSWDEDGIQVGHWCSGPDDMELLDALGDGHGGIWLAWTTWTTPTEVDGSWMPLFVERLNDAGAPTFCDRAP